MNSSLKSYIPALALLLDCSAAALYERQRALVRNGLLGIQEGRGPGTGVHVGPYSVALLLIAVLATDSLSDTAVRARAIAKARPIGPLKTCPLTARSCFEDALAQILSRIGTSRKIESILVNRTTSAVSINYKENGELKVSNFKSSAKKMPNLTTQATLSGGALVAIADGLFALLNEAENDDSKTDKRS